MEPETILAQLNKGLARRINQLALSVTSGGVDSMETYKYIIVIQEISNLLEPKEQKNEQRNVIDISGGSTKN